MRSDQGSGAPGGKAGSGVARLADKLKQGQAVEPGEAARELATSKARKAIEELAQAAAAGGEAGLSAHAVVRARELDPESVSARSVMQDLCANAALRNGAIEALSAHCGERNASAMANFVLAELLRVDGKLDQSREYYQRARDLDPELKAAADNYMAVTQAMVGDFAAAEAHWLREIEQSGDSADRRNNLGVAYAFQGRYYAAEREFRRAIALSPDSWELHQNTFWVCMLMRRLREGWKEHEWRDIVADKALLSSGIAEWRGEKITGATLLVVAEQGVGDEIMYASCLPDLFAAQIRCVVQCTAKLATLYQRSFPQAVILPRRDLAGLDGWNLPQPDRMVLAGTLPHFLRPTMRSFPAHSGYLRADPAQVEQWRSRLASLGARTVIGISWRGGNRPRDQRQRSIPLERWTQIVRRTDVAVVSLQYGDHQPEIQAAQSALGVPVHSFPDLDLYNDLDGMAALISALDLVISIDNSTVHLAGALGTPVWTMIPAVPDWRWFTGMDTTPWYPSMRVFRQSAPGDWDSVLTTVAATLDEWTPVGSQRKDDAAVRQQQEVSAAIAHARGRHAAGDLAEAERVYRAVLARYPDTADAWHLLGVVALQLGHAGPACEHITRAIELAPRRADYFADLGQAREAQGRAGDAVTALKHAVALEPAQPAFKARLADLLRLSGRAEEAIAAYQGLVDTGQAEAGVRNNLGVVLHELGRFPEAIAHFEALIAQGAESADLWSNLGLSRQGLKDMDGAQLAYGKALALEPGHAVTHYNLGLLYQDLGQLDEAIACYRRATGLNPALWQAWTNLGNSLLHSARIADALDSYGRAGSIPGGAMRAQENTVFASNYSVDLGVEEIARLHRELGARIEAGIPVAPRRRTAIDPERVLRVGFVSPDFNRHSVAFFLQPLFAHMDRDRFELYAYSNSTERDEVTNAFKGEAQGWRDVVRLEDAQVHRLIHDDAIDVLIDCAGHTRGGRLTLFARRAAPVQLTGIGYPNTTGLTAVDFRITDETADPPGYDSRYTERLWRLPGCHVCYQPPAPLPDAVRSAPTDAVVFGSFNGLTKVNPRVLDAWAQLLSEVPGSRLLLKNKYLAGEGTRAQVLAWLGERGVDAGRVELRPWSRAVTTHIADYGEVDIALDTFPYNGVTTTFEALLMGVPLVTLAGDRHAGRMGASILGELDTGGAVCNDVSEYVAAARKLAESGPRSDALRRELRAALLASPLTDGPAYARCFEQAVRNMWLQKMGEPS